MFPVGVRMLVSTGSRISFCMVWQPILVGGDADQILEAYGNARFLVRLQLWQTKDHITFESGAGNQVFMTAAGMVTVYFCDVVVRPEVMTRPTVPGEFAKSTQIKRRGPIRVSWH